MQRISRLCKDVPVGYSFHEVFEKAKALYKAAKFFTMSPHKTSSKRVIWTAEVRTTPPFNYAKGTIFYKYNSDLDEWVEAARAD